MPPMLILSLSGMTEHVSLPNELEVLQNSLVITMAGLMCGTEFLEDKIPEFDSILDSVHIFIRIPLGVLLTGDAMAGFGPVSEIVGMIIGGGLTSATYFTKADTRTIY